MTFELFNLAWPWMGLGAAVVLLIFFSVQMSWAQDGKT